MSTRRPGSATPDGGRSRRALATEKMVVLAPMPMASDSAAVSVKSGLRQSSLRPYRASCQRISSTPASLVRTVSDYYGGAAEKLTGRLEDRGEQGGGPHREEALTRHNWSLIQAPL